MARALHAERVAKRYRGAYVLEGVDLALPLGECVAVVGANGAGKSTLLRLLARLEEPTRGRVWLDGAPDLDAHRASVGYLGHDLGIYDDLTAREQLDFASGLRGAPLADAVRELLGLAAFFDRPLAACSRGQRQRAALAQALIGEPPLLILDEPTTGLDATTAAALAELLRARAAAGALVLLSTHEEAFHRATATALIDVGARRAKVTRGAHP